MKRFLIIQLFILLTLSAEAATYYVDAVNGNDRNSGSSADRAWQSISRANKAKLSKSDRLHFKAGATYIGILELSDIDGSKLSPVTIGSYGDQGKATISAPDGSLYAVMIKNSNYVTLENLKIVNRGSKPHARRTGVLLKAVEFGTSRGITLRNLDICDVNGSLIKKSGGGSGILVVNEWEKLPTAFDSLLIEMNTISNCQRNGINFKSSSWSRRKWHASTNVVIRKNLLEGIPGDGIVPIGCEGALVEYNLMRNCSDAFIREDLKGEAAAGIWAWSCDNTIIQYNEVSDHKALWDGQGFDSDYNCKGSIIRYNYSHDNHGGFILICDAGREGGAPDVNCGNIGSVIEYNLSIGDGVRPTTTNRGIFSPSIHISGLCDNTTVRNNIIHVTPKPEANIAIDRTLIEFDNWGNKYPRNTTFHNNIFYLSEPSRIRFIKRSPTTIFENNYILSEKCNGATDNNHYQLKRYTDTISTSHEVYTIFTHQMTIAGGATLRYIDKETIERFMKH